jgi:hypothetical protein
MKCSFVYLIPRLDLNLYIPNQFTCKAVPEREYIEACSVENAYYKLILRYFGEKKKSMKVVLHLCKYTIRLSLLS